jgi:hypothetical protein
MSGSEPPASAPPADANTPTSRGWRRAVLWLVTGFYAYGALVHLLNIAGLTGFHWPDAPLKWQLLDILYLTLDAIVVAGLARCWRASIIAFGVAAVSQILLYTLLRGWVLDVPGSATVPGGIHVYLNGLVVLHGLTLAAVWLALRPPAGEQPGDT